MKKYIAPAVEIDLVEAEDVIVASGGSDVNKYYSPIYDKEGYYQDPNWLTWLG